jgi:AraC-like DNA-binding protein
LASKLHDDDIQQRQKKLDKSAQVFDVAPMGSYRSIRFGVDRVSCGDIARHVHREAYANVILAGSFTEAAFAGRSRVRPGMVLLHGAFDAHANVEGGNGGPTIIRLPWAGGCREGAYRVRDPDQLARLSETDLWEAERALADMLEPVDGQPRSWADDLATVLTSPEDLCLRQWAEERSLNPTSLSRGFRNAFGVSPQRFRLEARTREAWRRIVTELHSFTQIAHETGFADLAHMNRSVAALTGAGPTHWRGVSNGSAPGLTCADASRTSRL